MKQMTPFFVFPEKSEEKKNTILRRRRYTTVHRPHNIETSVKLANHFTTM